MDIEKERRAIEVLRSFEPQDEPYYLCYSGGKDSDCIRILAQLAGVKHEIHHNLTTVDAPETIQYIKSIPKVIINKARWNKDSRTAKQGDHKTMWNLIPHKLAPPTRMLRYCCTELKEIGGAGRLKITGVRKTESRNRNQNSDLVKIIGKSKTMQKYAEENNVNFLLTPMGGVVLNTDDGESRRMVEHCFRTTSTMVNPIIDWSENDVWDFLHHYGCESNPLYKCGSSRIGCVGCPMAGGKHMKKSFLRYPKIRDNYIRSFRQMLKTYKQIGKEFTWKNGVDVLRWWVQDDPIQMRFFEEDYLKDIPDELYEEI